MMHRWLFRRLDASYNQLDWQHLSVSKWTHNDSDQILTDVPDIEAGVRGELVLFCVCDVHQEIKDHHCQCTDPLVMSSFKFPAHPRCCWQDIRVHYLQIDHHVCTQAEWKWMFWCNTCDLLEVIAVGYTLKRFLMRVKLAQQKRSSPSVSCSQLCLNMFCGRCWGYKSSREKRKRDWMCQCEDSQSRMHRVCILIAWYLFKCEGLMFSTT